MANCGCKPCSKPLPKKTKKCKPFTICVGNHSLIWDGECASIQKRKFQIKDGTYTSITFSEGCIVGVGQAPLAQYTPQVCCDEGVSAPQNGGVEVVAGKDPGNLATVVNGAVSVVPQWGTSSKTIQVKGLGTANNPWVPTVKVSPSTTNRLKVGENGLEVDLHYKSSSNVEITGSGTKADPWVFTVLGADAKLPEINPKSYEFSGFDVDKFGRMVNIEDGVQFVTNIAFSSKAFTVAYAGNKTMVQVDETLLRTGESLVTTGKLIGKGTTAQPLDIKLDEETIGEILTEIDKSEVLKQRLRQILGV